MRTIAAMFVLMISTMVCLEQSTTASAASVTCSASSATTLLKQPATTTTRSASPKLLSDTRTGDAGSSPASLYRRLSYAISDLDAHAIIFFNAGTFETTTPVTGVVHWHFDEGTYADVTVHARNGHIGDPQHPDEPPVQVCFNKPIHIWLPINGGVSVKLRAITYDQNGIVSDDDAAPDHGANNHYIGSGHFNRIFDFVTSPSGVLLGSPFKNATSLKQCHDGNNDCEPTSAASLAYEVQLNKSGATAGFFASLAPTPPVGEPAPTYELTFAVGNAHNPRNYLDIGPGSSVTLDDVDYLTDEEQLSGTIVQLTLNVQGGRLLTNNTDLEISPGSTFQIQQVTFAHTPNGVGFTNKVDCDGGILKGNLRGGSLLTLATDPTTKMVSRFSLADGSGVDLENLGFHVDDGSYADLSFDNSSTETLQLSSGLLALKDSTFLRLGPSGVTAHIGGHWSSDPASRATAFGKLVNLTAQITGGALNLNSATSVGIDSGAIAASTLTIDSTLQPMVTGTIDTFSLFISDRSSIGFPGGLQLQSAPGAVIKNASASAGIQVGSGMSFPVGAYTIDIPFRTLTNGGAGNFRVFNGHAVLPLQTFSDGSVCSYDGGPLPLTCTPSPSWLISNAQLTFAVASSNLSMTTNITKGSFLYQPGTHRAQFSGTLSGVVDPGFVFPFHVDHDYNVADDDLGSGNGKLKDQRFYDFNASLKFAGATLPPTTITIGDANSSATTFSVSIPITASLLIPQGVPPNRGEHDSDNDADGTHGPAENQPLQEIYQSGYNKQVGPIEKKLCQNHIYVIDGSYPTAIDTQFSLTGTGLDASVSLTSVDGFAAENQGWRRNGCDAATIFALLGGIVAGPPGAIGGAVAGHKLNGRISDIIDGLIYEKINSLHKTWHVNL